MAYSRAARVVTVLFLFFLITGLASKPPPQGQSPSWSQEYLEAVAAEIRDRLQSERVRTVPDLSKQRQLYSARDFQPIWIGNQEAEQRREQALDALQQADREGLGPALYRLEDALSFSNLGAPADIAKEDIALSSVFLHYMNDVRLGRVKRDDFNVAVGIPAVSFDNVSVFSQAISENALDRLISALPPPYPEYKSLRVALMLALERNEPEKAQQIKANMERWRWLPHALEPRHIIVDIADAKLYVIDNGKIILDSRVIVGKRSTPTPIMRGEVTGVTVNPYWNVPASIARGEMLPKLQQDSFYLQSQNIFVLNGLPGDPYGIGIDWKNVSANNFPYRLRQEPGEGNALGFIKLEMMSPFSVYLHDTSARGAFARESRFLSHGCIRVEKIEALASFALSGNVGTEAETLSAAVESGQTQTFALSKPLPVYTVYWTVIADADGSAMFRPDIYGLDAQIIKWLSPPSFGIAPNDISFACGSAK